MTRTHFRKQPKFHKKSSFSKVAPTSPSATPSLPDSPEGFARFYEMLYGRRLPRHARRDWIQPLYKARAAGKGLVVFAFRGASKSTTLSIAFTAFRLGLHPEQSALIIQAADDIAADTAAQIADLIEHNPGWHEAFPHILPDPAVAWGADGYEIRNTQYGYDDWRTRVARTKGKDPSFVALGYKSRAIIGKHPTGLLLIDDIHDESNTRSARELETVVKILTGTILPTATASAWQIAVGTPWREDDALARLAATGRFISVSTRIFRSIPLPAVGAKHASPDSAAGGNSIEPIEIAAAPGSHQTHTVHAGRGTLDEKRPAWPRRFPLKAIERIRQAVGEAEFARMYMLDPRAAQGIHLKAEWLNEFPMEKIGPHWPVVMGVDYASTGDLLKSSQRDYFAVAVGRAIPGGGGIVLVDGIRARLSQGEAEEQLVELAARYPTLSAIGVEAVGKGEEYFHLMQRSYLQLPLEKMDPGGMKKGQRIEGGMGLMFQRHHAWIAEVETPFLRAFRDEWLAWPRGAHDDTLDAVAWMLAVAEKYLLFQPRKPKTSNPFMLLARS